MKKELLFIVVILCCCCSNLFGQNKEIKQVGMDGFVWYEVIENGKHGAKDVNGKIIIPCEYRQIDYFEIWIKHFLVWTDSNKKGIFSPEGKCIIPTSRQYTSIQLQKNDGVGYYYEVAKMPRSGVWTGIGACDVQGNEVIFIKGADEIYPFYSKGKMCYRFRKNTLLGIVDGNGKIVISAKYRDWPMISEDGAYFIIENVETRKKTVIGKVSQVATTYNPFAGTENFQYASNSRSTQSSDNDKFDFVYGYYTNRNYENIHKKVNVKIYKSNKTIRIDYGNGIFTFKFKEVEYKERSGDYDDIGGFGFLLAVADQSEIIFYDDNYRKVKLIEDGGIIFDEELKELPIFSVHNCSQAQKMFKTIKAEMCK